MIASSTLGKGFLGLQRYLLQGPRDDPTRLRVVWTATRNLASSDPTLAAAQMRATAAQAPRVEKPVYHLSLSAAPGEVLSRARWEAIADRLLAHLGLEGHQVLLVAHDDTGHAHIHLMINRVHPERLRAWRGSFSKARIQELLRELEKKLGLRQVPGTLTPRADETGPWRDQTRTRGEHRQALREAQPATVERWRALVRTDLLEAQSWTDLAARLARHGLRLKARGRGLVVTDGRVQIKISRLHRRASIHQLEERFGVGYRKWRSDLGRFEQALEPIAIRLEKRLKLREAHSRLAAELRSGEARGAGSLGAHRVVRSARDLSRKRRRLERLARRIDEVTEGIRDDVADRRLALWARTLGIRAASQVLPPRLSRALLLVVRGEHIAHWVSRSR